MKKCTKKNIVKSLSLFLILNASNAFAEPITVITGKVKSWGGDILDILNSLYSGINPIGLGNVTNVQDPRLDISFTVTNNRTTFHQNTPTF